MTMTGFPFPLLDFLLSIEFLGAANPRSRNLQTDLAAFRQEDVHGLLRILCKLTLHKLNIFVCFRLEFGGGIATGSSFDLFM